MHVCCPAYLPQLLPVCLALLYLPPPSAGNFYGAVLTMRHAAALGRLDGVVRGWEELDEILTR